MKSVCRLILLCVGGVFLSSCDSVEMESPEVSEDAILTPVSDAFLEVDNGLVKIETASGEIVEVDLTGEMDEDLSVGMEIETVKN